MTATSGLFGLAAGAGAAVPLAACAEAIPARPNTAMAAATDYARDFNQLPGNPLPGVTAMIARTLEKPAMWGETPFTALVPTAVAAILGVDIVTWRNDPTPEHSPRSLMPTTTPAEQKLSRQLSGDTRPSARRGSRQYGSLSPGQPWPWSVSSRASRHVNSGSLTPPPPFAPRRR